MFIEFMVACAKMTYMTDQTGHDAMHNERGGDRISIIKALNLFIGMTLKPFKQDQNIEWQSFRDERLWCPEVRLTYTMNEQHILEIYKKYCANNLGRGIKGYKPEFMDLDDCYKLCITDK